MTHGYSYVGLVLVAAVGLFSLAGGLSAQGFGDDERESTFEVRAGTAVPGSDLETYFDPGFSAGLGVTFPLSERVSFAVGGDVGFLSDIREDEEVGTGEVRQFFDGDLRLWHYGGDLQFDVVDPANSDMSVILHGGLGATTIDPERTVVIEGPDDPVFRDADTRTRFTANVGLSLGFGITDNVDLLIDGKAYSIFVDEQDFEREETVEDFIGETWWSFPVQAMLRFRAP